MTATRHNSKRKPILGCIADDVTGATDLAINLVQGGMCVVQLLDIPTPNDLAEIDADAVVVALKTRSIAKDDAVAQSLACLFAMQTFGIERFYFKYCSTFDSTEDGNIGPVAVALLNELGARQTIFCPAFPRNGRTVYQGHLFVHGRLLNESGMEHHPLNPMTDANLVRFLGKQVKQDVHLIPYVDLSSVQRCTESLAQLRGASNSLVVMDTCDDQHLRVIAEAASSMPLVTGGSGLARYLPDAYRTTSLFTASEYVPTIPTVRGRSLIISGSCSKATNQQVQWMQSKCASLEIDIPAILRDPKLALSQVVQWAEALGNEDRLLIYSTADAERVSQIQAQFGNLVAAEAIEQFLANVAATFVKQLGVTRLVLAGGETSGAIVKKLGVGSLRIGPEICAGVPWTETLGEGRLAMALKSGNFGDEDFFDRALEMLP